MLTPFFKKAFFSLPLTCQICGICQLCLVGDPIAWHLAQGLDLSHRHSGQAEALHRGFLLALLASLLRYPTMSLCPTSTLLQYRHMVQYMHHLLFHLDKCLDLRGHALQMHQFRTNAVPDAPGRVPLPLPLPRARAAQLGVLLLQVDAPDRAEPDHRGARHRVHHSEGLTPVVPQQVDVFT